MNLTLQNLRKSLGLTQQQLANRLNLPVEMIIALENESSQAVSALIRLAIFFNVTVDEILGPKASSETSRACIELLFIFNNLDTRSKGRLLERARSLSEKSQEQKTAGFGWRGMLLTLIFRNNNVLPELGFSRIRQTHETKNAQHEKLSC